MGRLVLPAPRPLSAGARGQRIGELRSTPAGLMRWDGSDWSLAPSIGLPDGIPRGVLAGGITRRTANLLSQASELAVLSSVVGYVIDPLRAYRITAGALLAVTTSGSTPQLALRTVSGTAAVSSSSQLLDLDRGGSLTATGLTGAERYAISRDLAPGELPAGTWSFGLTGALISGTGSWSCYADPTYPAFLTIEDKGIPGAVAVP